MAKEEDEIRAMVARLAQYPDLDDDDKKIISALKEKVGLYEQPKNDEAAYSAQHPIIGGIEAIGKEAEPIVKGFEAVTGALSKPLDAVKKFDPVSSTLQKTGQKIRDVGLTLEDKSDKLLTSGNYGRLVPQLGRFIGIALENSPLPASTEEAIGGALLEGANVARGPLARGTKEVAKKAPGVKSFIEQEKMPAVIDKEMKRFTAERNDAAQTTMNLKASLDKLTEKNLPQYDSVKYGEGVKKLLDAKTKEAATPLRRASQAIENITETFGKGTVEHLAPAVKAIKEDLASIIKISPDTPAFNIINKYLGEQVKDKIGGTYTVYPEASVGELLKDRGRVGKAIISSMEDGGKLTPQSTALYKLQRVIDGEIDLRLKDTPDLAKLADVTRQAWREHYGMYWSDQAVALRKVEPSKIVNKILESPESLSSAKTLIPEAFEEAVRTKKTELIKSLEKATNPVEFVENELTPGRSSKPAGYYDRLLKPEEVIELRQVASVASRLPEATARMEAAIKSLQAEPIKGRRIGEKLGFRSRRAGESGLGFLDSLKAIQGTRLAVPVEAVALASMVRWISPEAAKIIVAAGVTPAAAAWAYYSVPKPLRIRISSAIRRVAESGPKAPAADLQLLRRIERGETLDKKGEPTAEKPKTSSSLGLLNPLREEARQPLPFDIQTTPIRDEGISMDEEPLTYEEARARGLTE